MSGWCDEVPVQSGAMLGGGSTDAVRGFSHKVLLGILPRLAGADATIFPNFGGRFGFSVEAGERTTHSLVRSCIFARERMNEAGAAQH